MDRSCLLRDLTLPKIILKLAVVSFLPEELYVMMLAVEFPLMGNIIGRANSATSMAALEAAPMICSAVYRNLLSWINGLIASHTFISGAHKFVGDFLCILIFNKFFRFHNLWCSFKTLLQAASSLEELIKVRPAIQHPLKGIEVAELEGAFAMVAPEASFVIDPVIGR